MQVVTLRPLSIIPGGQLILATLPTRAGTLSELRGLSESNGGHVTVCIRINGCENFTTLLVTCPAYHD
jgi:hypothetical protein